MRGWRARRREERARLDRHDREIAAMKLAFEGIYRASQAPAAAGPHLTLVDPGPDDTGPMSSVA
jgi:hypothetical protein